MKQIVCKEIGRFEFEEVATPACKPNEALIRIHKIGICGTDLHAFEGQQPFFVYPRILGHELSATIEQLPANTGGFAVGDPVVVIPYISCGTCIACRNQRPNCCTSMNVIGVHSDGGMREFMPVPVDRLISAKGLSFEDAALVECLSIGAHAVRRAAIKKGEYVLVIGAGPIGVGAIQFAKVAGAKVIAMDVVEHRLNFCREQLGVDYAISALEQPVEKLKEITGGDFPTVVIDATGNPKSMSNCVNYLAHGGRIVYIGLFIGDLSFSDIEFHKRECTMMSSRNATVEDFEQVISLLKSGEVKSSCMITHHSDLTKMIADFPTWLKPDQNVIKAMIDVAG